MNWQDMDSWSDYKEYPFLVIMRIIMLAILLGGSSYLLFRNSSVIGGRGLLCIAIVLIPLYILLEELIKQYIPKK